MKRESWAFFARRQTLVQALPEIAAAFAVIVLLSLVIDLGTKVVFANSLPSKDSFDKSSVKSNAPAAPYYLYLPYIPMAISCSTAQSPIDWDPRLGPNSDPILYPDLQQVRIIPASVGHGEKFWRAIKVRFEGLGESGNDHTIYLKVIDENCNRVAGIQARMIGEYSGLLDILNEKNAGDTCNCDFDYPMFGDEYDASIYDGSASESVAGMCMCGIPNVLKGHAHVNFRITFQRLTKP